MRFVLLAVALAATCVAASTQPTTQRVERGALRLENVPETPRDVAERISQYVNSRGASFADWMPDGSVLILTRFGDTNQLHRVAAPLADRRQLTFFPDRVTGASVRPGTNDIVFTRDLGGNEQFGGYLLDPNTGAVTQFTEPSTRNESFIWRDDGQRIAWSYVPSAEPNYDIVEGAPGVGTRRILDGEGAMSPLDYSPDGARLLLRRNISAAEARLFVLDEASGATTELTPDLDVAYTGGAFTADGRGVLTISDEGADFTRLVRIDLANSQRTVLSEGVSWGVEAFEQSHDGRTIAYSVNEAGNSRLYLMDARTRRALPAPALTAGVINGMQFDAADQRLAFSFDRATAPADVYVWDLSEHTLRRWTHSETGGLPPSAFVEPEVIRWRSFDNREITGFLYRPRTPGPHPVVINIHGGPEGQFRPTFSPTIQYWVNELGIAVIAPNVRGSTGFGKQFLALDNAERREDSVRDIGALLDWIDTQPTLDRRRVVAYGGSYGGYMVLAAMTHYNDRLAAAVDVVGISNFVTFLQNTSGYRRDLRRAEYGDERDPAMQATLERISPLTNIARVTKPMLVVAGFNDPRVPYTESEQVAAAIRRNGGEVWFMMAMNEGHGFQRRENQQAQREAETLFFRRVLNLNQAQTATMQ